ncbi:MAG: hypothetical protein HYT89_05440 [Candidatus Omnitrophica bacterium]|nr:hypothetical protein [Candidatus Omnitrophota bacterium]
MLKNKERGTRMGAIRADENSGVAPSELQNYYSLYKKIRKNYDSISIKQKVELLSKAINKPLKHILGCTYDTIYFRNNIENPFGIVQIPLALAGPIEINGKYAKGKFFVPMATTEGALVLTYDLGMRLLRLGKPIEAEVISKQIHLDPMFIITQNEDKLIQAFVRENFLKIKEIAESKSNHTTLLKIEEKKINNNYVLKFIYDTADAHGLNMINEATYNACKFIESSTRARFFHRSHYSAVKHHSLRNEREGYGKKVRARVVITEKALKMIGVTALQLKDFTDRCIECGTAAEVSAINVHASNAIAAIYLATGQDMADISSSHVCKSFCEPINENKDLYFEVVLPNLLIATVGGGTGLGTQRECLEIMDCFGSDKADKLAEIMAASVLAGEFTTAAAVVNETYVDIHNKYGRNKNKIVP